jgi:hypothetical protein
MVKKLTMKEMVAYFSLFYLAREQGLSIQRSLYPAAHAYGVFRLGGYKLFGMC